MRLLLVVGEVCFVRAENAPPTPRPNLRLTPGVLGVGPAPAPAPVGKVSGSVPVGEVPAISRGVPKLRTPKVGVRTVWGVLGPALVGEISCSLREGEDGDCEFNTGMVRTATGVLGCRLASPLSAQG